MRITDSTPKADGFYMPCELDEHRCIYILWPQREDNWRQNAEPAQAVFKNLIQTMAKYEPVVVGTNADQYRNLIGMNMPNVSIVEISNNDSWIRDSGPSCVINGEGRIRGVDWAFNGYGGLVNGIYFPWDLDDLIGAKVCNIEGIDRYRTDDFVLEGGAICVDGEGTVIVTEETLLDPGRNPDLTKDQIEEKLKEYLGAEKVLWIPDGLYGDEDTNGHVDNVVQFVKPGKVVLSWEDNPDDPQYERSQKALEYLQSVTDAKGRQIEVVKLHVPAPMFITKEESQGVDAVDGTFPRIEGARLAGSYVNFGIVNGAILCPQFDNKYDAEAMRVLQECYPDRVTEPIAGAREILLGGGNIHCITQQVPKP